MSHGQPMTGSLHPIDETPADGISISENEKINQEKIVSDYPPTPMAAARLRQGFALAWC